jgi:mRNA interferase MazF
MVMERGEIWWASLPEPTGSMPGYRRPVLVVQDNAFNHSRIRTVLVVALTSNVKLAAAPGNVELPAAATGLPQTSVANISQIITVDKSLLTEYVGQLPDALLRQVESGLRPVLSL